MITRPSNPGTIRALACLSIGLVLIAGTASAQLGNFKLDQEAPGPRNITEPEGWKESGVVLPPWPKDGDLIEISPDGVTGPFRFYIDGANLGIDRSGGVVRYTIVVEGKNGTRNVSYEGVRCTIRGHYKTYAYGSGGRFMPVGDSDWQEIPASGTQAYLRDLFANRFCVPRETRPRVENDILRALNDRGSPRYSTGFQAD